ncbi:hypothetical protein K402DRAFT_321291 [Aulographum hederae CBS 113979]|uniref:RRN7-type domain-containing protein n=1 Tax=Aulographum hederae CBS 113979 TaxID=1176131 RepID=A0A6G1HGK6_9PEZI|nr:hypothetical protein K402DRAFT_321291 [Aulographum hederae CBS 113979]
MERKTGPRCGEDNCSSRRYHLDSGSWWCERGHRSYQLDVKGVDDDGFTGGQNVVTATKRKEKQERVQTLFTGGKKIELYLQCYQFVLRQQCWALIHEKGLPAELETVVHDLWVLRLQNFSGLLQRSDLEDSVKAQEFSTQSDAEDEEKNKYGLRRQTAWTHPESLPNLIQTLALCYLSSVILRFPLLIGDLVRWANAGEIVYMTASKSLQESMKQRLHGFLLLKLEASSILAPDQLQTVVTDVAANYNSLFGVEVPALSYPPLLYRIMRELCLPLDVYPAAVALKELLQYQFSFPSAKEKEPKKYSGADQAQVQLVCCIVIAVKLLYPFDQAKRYPHTSAEPASTVLDWDVWASKMKDPEPMNRDGPLTNQEAWKITEGDIMAMDKDRLDDYLDWYEKTIMDEEVLSKAPGYKGREVWFDTFPVSSTRTREPPPSPALSDHVSDTTQRLRDIQSSLKMRRAVTDKEAEKSKKEVQRPGSGYRFYLEPIHLEGHARLFYEKTADFVGMSVVTLLRTVGETEKRVKRRWRAKKEDLAYVSDDGED